MQKFILCRPQGGLNDVLNQIEWCCQYATLSNRLVIVDSAYRHSAHFKDAFSKYFVSREKPLLLENPLSDKELDALDAYPSLISGRVSSYRAIKDSRRNVYADFATGCVLTFDHRKQHRETVLVHHQEGGGLRSMSCLSRLILAPWLADRLENRLRVLGDSFAAVHIRNTDMTTDYQVVIDDLVKRSLPRLFLATYNKKVLDDFKMALPDTQLYSFSTLPENGGRPIHINLPREDAEIRNSDAILDLLTLALARPLVVVEAQNAFKSKYSGFTRLAESLNEDSEALRRLLNRNLC
jgi:hypothetical protein